MITNELTLTQAHDALEKGETTSEDLARACFEIIKKRDPEIHAFLTVTEVAGLAAARASDERRRKGKSRGMLDGIPLAIKDNITIQGVRTTAASKILEHYVAPYDATVITKLKNAGAICVGRTNLDEFAHGASTESSAFGVTKNPHDITRVAGGSSGGSAAAVSSHMCVAALGSDTGGSIRNPAAFCGVVGLKPSYGRVSRYGLLSMTSSTDVIGPITKTVEDSAILLFAIAGGDEQDSTTAPHGVKDYRTYLEGGVKKLRIGLPKEYFVDGIDEEVRVALDEVKEQYGKMGAELIEVSLTHTKYAIPVYYILTPSEISSNLARYDGVRYGHHANGETLSDVYARSRAQGFGPEAKRRIMIGTYALSAGYYDQYYNQAAKVRTLLRRDFDEVFKKVDVLLTPVSPHVAFKIGEKIDDPLQMYLEDIFVTAPSLAGLPAISVPCANSGSMPIGFQLIGKAFDEETILRAAYSYEQTTR